MRRTLHNRHALSTCAADYKDLFTLYLGHGGSEVVVYLVGMWEDVLSGGKYAESLHFS
jgi:hypothetical protein